MKVTEGMITKSLKKRADKRNDLFFSQVKMGRGGTKIIDAVAIKKTWSPITVEGYEIKCSRSDFLNDHKYPHYMTTCHEFSFVVPKGIIKKDEIPSDVGLIEYNPEKGTLRTVKKAPYRNIEVMPEMLLHCLFWKLDDYNRQMTRQEYLDDYKAKVESKDYGNEVAEKIRLLERKLNGTSEDRYKELIDDVEKKTGKRTHYYEMLKMLTVDTEEIKRYLDIKHHLDSIGKAYSK